MKCSLRKFSYWNSDFFKKDTRVTPTDCEWLIRFWRSEEAKKRSEQGKKNRQKQKVLHTSGSKSHARVTTEMHKENGFPPRRDEVFIRTHQSKKGKPQTKETIEVIEKIGKAIDEHPELLEKTIQQGDILAHVLGKEKNGYVRCVGLGPNAGTLGMLGAQRLKSTRLQMAELEAEKAWRASELLKEHVDEVKNDTKAQIDALMEEVSQLRMIVSQSNSGNNNSMLNLEHVDSVGESAAWDEEHHLLHDEEELLEQELREATEQLESMKLKATLLRKKKEAALIQNREAAQHQNREAEIVEKKRKETEMQKKAKEAEELLKKEAEKLRREKEAEQLQKKKEQALLQKKKEQVQLQKKLGAPVTQKNLQQGNEVMLYNVFRDHSIPVAKGTVQSTDRKKIVGGRELGTECCEVVVDYIMKKDAILPRPVGNVTTIGQAQGRTIIWLYKHLEVQKSMAKQASPPQEE